MVRQCRGYRDHTALVLEIYPEYYVSDDSHLVKTLRMIA